MKKICKIMFLAIFIYGLFFAGKNIMAKQKIVNTKEGYITYRNNNEYKTKYSLTPLIKSDENINNDFIKMNSNVVSNGLYSGRYNDSVYQINNSSNKIIMMKVDDGKFVKNTIVAKDRVIEQNDDFIQITSKKSTKFDFDIKGYIIKETENSILLFDKNELQYEILNKGMETQINDNKISLKVNNNDNVYIFIKTKDESDFKIKTKMQKSSNFIVGDSSVTMKYPSLKTEYGEVVDAKVEVASIDANNNSTLKMEQVDVKNLDTKNRSFDAVLDDSNKLYAMSQTKLVITQKNDSCTNTSNANNIWECKISELFKNKDTQDEVANKLGVSVGSTIKQSDIDNISTLDIVNSTNYEVKDLTKVTFSNLKTLNLSNNNLKEFSLDNLKMPRLEKIDLSKNSLVDTFEKIEKYNVNLKDQHKNFGEKTYIVGKDIKLDVNIPLIDKLDTKVDVYLDNKKYDYEYNNNTFILKNIDTSTAKNVKIEVYKGNDKIGEYQQKANFKTRLQVEGKDYSIIVLPKPAISVTGNQIQEILNKDANEENKIEQIEDLTYNASKGSTTNQKMSEKINNTFFSSLEIKTTDKISEVISILKKSGKYELVVEDKLIPVNEIKYEAQAKNKSKNSYHLSAIGSSNAWKREKNSGVTVGVFDTSLSRNYVASKKNYTYHGDLNGKIVAYSRNSERSNCSVDGGKHGDRVTSVIAAKNNSYGVTGVSRHARIAFSHQATTNDGQSCGRALNSTRDIITNVSRFSVKYNIRVANMSFGAVGREFETNGQLQTFTSIFNKFNILFVVSASNNNKNNVNFICKSSSPNMMCVGNSDNRNRRNLSSNYHGGYVDTFAPGTGIRTISGLRSYSYSSGTSMSAPVVSGIAAQLFSRNPNMSPLEAKSIIMQTGIYRNHKGKKYDPVSRTYRVVNASNAMSYYLNLVSLPKRKYSNTFDATHKFYVKRKKGKSYVYAYKEKRVKKKKKTRIVRVGKRMIFRVNGKIDKIYATKTGFFIVTREKNRSNVYIRGSFGKKLKGLQNGKTRKDGFRKIKIPELGVSRIRTLGFYNDLGDYQRTCLVVNLNGHRNGKIGVSTNTYYRVGDCRDKKAKRNGMPVKYVNYFKNTQINSVSKSKIYFDTKQKRMK